MKAGDRIAAKYRLERVLGTGAMGEVWAAVDESSGRPVAVKLLNSSAPELRARMLREARAGGTIKHKNVVDVFDVGQTEGGDPFLVMERLSGETLADRLKRVGKLAPAKAVEITVSIAAALRVAHQKGIVHRDLKPANVFLHRELSGEVVKVLDFGVSKHLAEATGTLTGGLVGSPAYMSPEQARAEPNIDARSDLWSLGVVLFEMLSARRPFPAASPYVAITEVITGPIPSIAEVVPELSPLLVDVVKRCLTRDVSARVASADELILLLTPPETEEEPTGRREAAPPSSEPTTKKLDELARSAPIMLTPRSRQREITMMVDLSEATLDDHGSRAPPPAVASTESITTPFKVGQSRSTYRIPEAEAAAGTTAPLVLVGEEPETLAMGDRSAFPRLPRRGPSNVVVAAVAGAAALLVIVVFGVALQRAPPAAEGATSVASTGPPPPVDSVAPLAPPPAATMAPEAPSPSLPTTTPRLGKDEALIVVDAPEATTVSLDGKSIGTVPLAPMVVRAGSHRLFFKHPTLGERSLVVEMQAGETSLAAAEFGADGGTRAQTLPRAHPKGEKRLVMP